MKLRSIFLAAAIVSIPSIAQPRVAAAQGSAQGAQPSQTADRAAILTTVQQVFDAMRTRDTALLRQAFDTTARLVGVSSRGASPSVTLTSPAQFGAAITRAPAGDVWHERIWEPDVRIDGTVAQVWAYYTFHRNAVFTHCGVDAFMLVKVGAAWKITQLADSRRTEGCTHTEPPSSPAQR
jgi:hypothetical protein